MRLLSVRHIWKFIDTVPGFLAEGTTHHGSWVLEGPAQTKARRRRGTKGMPSEPACPPWAASAAGARVSIALLVPVGSLGPCSIWTQAVFILRPRTIYSCFSFCSIHEKDGPYELAVLGCCVLVGSAVVIIARCKESARNRLPGPVYLWGPACLPPAPRAERSATSTPAAAPSLPCRKEISGPCLRLRTAQQE